MKIDIYTWEDDEGYKRQALYIDEVDGISAGLSATMSICPNETSGILSPVFVKCSCSTVFCLLL